MKRILPYIILIALSACSKSSSDKDKTAPIITLTNPTNGHVYSNGQKISISGTTTDDKALAEIHIHITNADDGTKFLDVHAYPDGNSFTLSNSDLTAMTGINYKIEVISIDRSANLTRSIINVSCI